MPPSSVLQASDEPEEATFATNAFEMPENVREKAPAVVGKPLSAPPTTKTFPLPSTATSSAESYPGPPKGLDHTIAPLPSSFVTNPSVLPPNSGWNGVPRGKFADAVEPTTYALPF